MTEVKTTQITLKKKDPSTPSRPSIRVMEIGDQKWVNIEAYEHLAMRLEETQAMLKSAMDMLEGSMK